MPKLTQKHTLIHHDSKGDVENMIAFTLAPPTIYDFFLAVFSLAAIYAALYIAVLLNSKGKPAWVGRKVIHISAGTIIALVLVSFSSLYAPAIALVFFLGSILLAAFFDLEIVERMVRAASREEGSPWGTMAAAVGAVISYGIVLFVTTEKPWIFVAAVLAVSWGDGAGELIGRPFGSRKYSVAETTRSLEGSLAVFVFTLAALVISAFLFRNGQINLLLFPIIVTSAVVTFLEAVSPYWTDNIFIPLSVAGLLLLLA